MLNWTNFHLHEPEKSQCEEHTKQTSLADARQRPTVSLVQARLQNQTYGVFSYTYGNLINKSFLDFLLTSNECFIWLIIIIMINNKKGYSLQQNSTMTN